MVVFQGNQLKATRLDRLKQLDLIWVIHDQIGIDHDWFFFQTIDSK